MEVQICGHNRNDIEEIKAYLISALVSKEVWAKFLSFTYTLPNVHSVGTKSGVMTQFHTICMKLGGLDIQFNVTKFAVLDRGEFPTGLLCEEGSAERFKAERHIIFALLLHIFYMFPEARIPTSTTLWPDKPGNNALVFAAIDRIMPDYKKGQCITSRDIGILQDICEEFKKI